MQVWKKVLSTLLALALLLSCCPAITLTASAADAISFSYSFSSFSGKSTQYAKETHNLGNGVYLDLESCHINTQLRIYSSNTNNGVAILRSENVITSITLNVGYKADKLNVYGSTDGSDWELIQAVSTATSYADKTVAVPEASGYHQIKLDVAGTNQLRIQKVSMTLVESVSTEPEEPEETTAPTEETTAPTEPEETVAPEIPEGQLAIFEFGEKAAAGHKDNTTAMTSGEVSYTNNGYTITFTDCASVYDKCNDEMGNSAIKFGTGSKIGSLTFTVADDVDYIVIKLAKYKANASKYSINGGTAVSLTKSSNDGEYEAVTVDTTTNKTVTIATVSGGLRMMMDSIAFYSNAGGTMPKPPVAPIEPTGEVYNVAPFQNMTIALDAKEQITILNFTYAMTTSGTMNIALMSSDGNSYYGYFAFNENGNDDVYDGVTAEKLTDNIYFVTMDVAALTKYTGSPNGDVANIYVRGNWTDATGTIYNIKINGGEPSEPEADTELSIAKAIELGLAKEHNDYTANKYYVTGVITEVYNTTYGNMKITDNKGNILTIYGTYSADGQVRYDAMEKKPEVGDTVKLYGIIGQYNGTAQMKNSWLIERTPAPTATVVLTPSKTEVKRGESFDVVVSVTEADAYTSMGFDLSMTDCPFIVENGAVLDNVTGTQLQDWDNTQGGVLKFSDAKKFTGDVFCVTLTVKEDTAFGEAIFTGTAAANNGTQPLKVTLIDAKVTVICEHETLDNYQAVDAETHQGTCAACGEVVQENHGFDGWAELDQNEHGKTCADCDYMQTEAHIFEDGLCNDCGCMEEYTVVFKNYDGTILHEETYYYADMIIEPEITPAKPADEVYSYVFAGWTPEFEEVTGDAEYVAVYEAVYVEYTVTFLDRNGAVLQTGVYHYGDPVTAPEAPAGYHDSKNLYTFSQWDKAVTEVTGNAVYTAQYEISGIRGDFDGDGKLTDRDAIYLLRCTLGMPNYELTQSGDVDGDGQTTDADVVYMLRHILFANRYPLY